MILGIVASGGSAPPFVPSDIANLKAWYDASDTATITVSGTAVTQWNDKSANGYNLTQGTAGKRPQSGTRTQNGLNAIDYDGSDDVLAASTAANWAFLNNSGGSTYFMAIYTDTASDGRMLLDTCGTTTGFVGVYSYVKSTDAVNLVVVRGVGGTVVSEQTTTQLATDNTASYWSFLSDPANATASNRCKIWKNGANPINTNIETAAVSNSNPQYPLGLGGQSFLSESFDGLMCEVIFYSGLLSDTDRGKVETYLAAKWGI